MLMTGLSNFSIKKYGSDANNAVSLDHREII